MGPKHQMVICYECAFNSGVGACHCHIILKPTFKFKYCTWLLYKNNQHNQLINFSTASKGYRWLFSSAIPDFSLLLNLPNNCSTTISFPGLWKSEWLLYHSSAVWIHSWVFHYCLSGVKPRSSSCNRLPSNGNAAQTSKEDGKKLQVEQTGAQDLLFISHHVL